MPLKRNWEHLERKDLIFMNCWGSRSRLRLRPRVRLRLRVPLPTMMLSIGLWRISNTCQPLAKQTKCSKESSCPSWRRRRSSTTPPFQHRCQGRRIQTGCFTKQAGQTQPEQYDSLSRIVEDLAEQFNRGEEAPPPDVNIAAANAVRRALIDKKMIPIRNMLMAKEDQEAGGKPTDIDAPTQEFERDSAADMCTVEMVKKTFREMVYTTAGALFSTASDATRIVGNVSSFDAEPEPGLISLGAIAYAGKRKTLSLRGNFRRRCRSSCKTGIRSFRRQRDPAQ